MNKPPPEAMLIARDLHKRYEMGPRSLEVLRGVSLKIARGDFLALRGASGTGKSTLLHLLGGLDSPNMGEIFFAGTNLASLSGRPAFAIAKSQDRFHFPGLSFAAGTGCAGKRLPAGAHGAHTRSGSRGART